MNHCIWVELALLSICTALVTSKGTIPLPKNKNRISDAKTTTLLWPVFLSMANNEVPIFGHIGSLWAKCTRFLKKNHCRHRPSNMRKKLHAVTTIVTSVATTVVTTVATRNQTWYNDVVTPCRVATVVTTVVMR